MSVGTIDKVYCSDCGIYRQVDINDVLAKNKKRVVCGPCGKVLMNEDDILEYFYYASYYGDPWLFTC